MGLGDVIKEAWSDYWPEGEDKPRVRWNCVHTDTEPTFDPMLGFPNGRKVREPVLSREQILDSRIDPDKRDYCAHKWIELFACIRDTSFFKNAVMRKCDPIKHAYEACQYEDYVLRSKEYERERRLRERQKRRIAMGLEPDPNATSEAM